MRADVNIDAEKAFLLIEHRRLRLNASALALLEAGVMPAQREEKPKTMDQLPEPWKDRFKITRALGKGAYGMIYQLQITCDKETDVFASVKVADKEAESFDEIKNLRRMSGAKHVISAVGKPDYVEEKDQMDILMPFLNHGDLQQMIVKCVDTQGCVCHKPQSRLCFEAMGKPWSKALILVYFYHAVQGVQEMHEKGLVHMDLKTQNIMLNCASADPTSCSAYLIDLGLGGPAGTLEVSGTPGFIAPEVWAKTAIGQPFNDIWSLGAVLYLLHYGRHTPAVKKQISLARLSTLKYNPEKDDVIPKGKDQSALDGLIVSMLNPDFRARIGVAEVLERLLKILQSMPDFNEDLQMMVSKTPKERGEVSMPQCIWDWKQPVKDIGNSKFNRNDCLEESSESERTSQTPPKMKRCQCNVLRNGNHVLEYFDAAQCL